MTDLTDFLLARIAEDEEWARPASGILGMDVAWHQPDVLHQRGINRADSHHITRWDPARVLAECRAKRAIVGYCGAADTIATDAALYALADASLPDSVTKGIDKAFAPVGPILEGAFAEILRLLATPYADHPDYREEWRP